jgi:hypothetical protein
VWQDIEWSKLSNLWISWLCRCDWNCGHGKEYVGEIAEETICHA